MSLTTDPKDPRLGHGVDTEPVEQHDVYLVLSEEERAKGWVRPCRSTYRHVGAAGPLFELRDLTADEQARWGTVYAKFETYPDEVEADGRFWTQEQLDNVGKGGCGQTTSMGAALSETYARQPSFYGATYCCTCRKHLPVSEFVWVESDGREVHRVGS